MATRKKATPAKKTENKLEEKERNGQVDAYEFVPVWQAADSAEAVNEHFHREGTWAGAYASRLRKYGVDLKIMPRKSGGKRLDIDALNKLC